MTYRISECECRLDYSYKLRKHELEEAVLKGDIIKLKDVLKHMQKYDYFRDLDAIFGNVEAHLKLPPLTERNVAKQAEMKKEIEAAVNAMKAYRDHTTAGIPPRRIS